MNTEETNVPEFEPFPKIARLRRNAIITEKIDGTNAQILITKDNQIFAGSRNRWLSTGRDNFGFHAWVQQHKDELIAGLGPGRHYGEWWGLGIQRGYGLDHKRFSLFNTHRWNEKNPPPSCCHVVPVLAQFTFSDGLVQDALTRLRTQGSVAAPGFMQPEGIVTFLAAAGTMYKTLLENDEISKTEAEAAA